MSSSSTLESHPPVKDWWTRFTLRFFDRADRHLWLRAARWTSLLVLLAVLNPTSEGDDVSSSILLAVVLVHVWQSVAQRFSKDESKQRTTGSKAEVVAPRTRHLEGFMHSHAAPPTSWKGFELRGQVQWFSLRYYLDCVFHGLLRSWRINVSDIRASYALEPKEFDYRTDEDLWVDFVSDTGDGFNAGLAVAQLLACDLHIDGLDLPQGRVLLHGGDLCYPFPQDMARFTEVMQIALPAGDASERRDLFMIPGNHEWCDGLQTFHNLLQQRNIAGWNFPQRSSYFVLRFSGWLVYALDMCEEPDIPDLDDSQFEFFERHFREHPSDRVLILTHVPDYIKNSHLGKQIGMRLAKLRAVYGERLAVQLSGDIHYYRRYEAEAGAPCTLIVAGGGGAFSHATSVPIASEVTIEGRTFVSEKCYPTPAECDKLFSSRALTMVHRGAMSYLGLFYAGMVSEATPVSHASLSVAGFMELVANQMQQCTSGSGYTFHLSVGALLLVHVIFSTASESGGFRFKLHAICLALTHTSTHVAAAFFIRGSLEWLHYFLFCGLASEEHSLTYRTGILLAVRFFGGWCGLAIYNMYFYFTFVFLHMNWNEAYCAIADEDHKSFLRMRVSPHGDLDIYVIGLETVPRQWLAARDSQTLEPIPPLKPHLIEHINIPAVSPPSKRPRRAS